MAEQPGLGQAKGSEQDLPVGLLWEEQELALEPSSALQVVHQEAGVAGT